MKYISLFSGIGGFEEGIKQAYEDYVTQKGEEARGQNIQSSRDKSSSTEFVWDGGRTSPTCIGCSEIDKYAIQVYEKHFNHKNYGDITKIQPENLPDFDLLVGGFPCQSFSIAGKRGGFNDTRGTLFFEIARIIKEKQPRLLLLENVKGLLSHDQGNTFTTIISTLDELGYDCQWQVLNSKNFGVPQNRERVFIVGNRRGTKRPNVFPLNYENYLTTIDKCDKMNVYEKTINEKVYQMSASVSENARTLLLGMEQSKTEKLSVEQMQDLFTQIEQGIQREECSEIEREPQDLRQESKGNIQEVETLEAFLGSENNTEGVCGVVSIPTEEMLLLWSNGGDAFKGIGQIQQQDSKNDNRQTGFKETLRSWKSSPLLFAVQPYKGGLFYSIGDGKDWVNIYKTKVEKICQQQISLSSILEEHVDPKYFLSEKMTDYLMKQINQTEHGHKPNLVQQSE